MHDEMMKAYIWAHYMNILYGVASICLTVKLAYIGRQVGDMGWQGLLFRIMAVLVGTVILAKASLRFGYGDQALVVDVVREFSWCGFLFAAILIMRKKYGRW